MHVYGDALPHPLPSSFFCFQAIEMDALVKYKILLWMSGHRQMAAKVSECRLRFCTYCAVGL